MHRTTAYFLSISCNLMSYINKYIHEEKTWEFNLLFLQPTYKIALVDKFQHPT